MNIADMPEWQGTTQGEHYKRLIADTERRIYAMPIDEQTAANLLRKTKRDLAERLEQEVPQVAALAARGMRVDELLH